MFKEDVIHAIAEVAYKVDVEPAALLAVAEVESAGIAFWSVGGELVPPARPEGHYFYKFLRGDDRTRAVREGLAAAKAGVVRVPHSYVGVYGMIDRMIDIDEEAAYSSCSWGLGQVMGAHWKVLGYDSALDLAASCDTVEGQADLMYRFIEKNHLDDELRTRKWAAFARAYNGPAYRKNRYDTKMASAYARYKKIKIPVSVPGDSDYGLPTPSMTKAQANLEMTKGIQLNLAKLGYSPGTADGVMGRATRTALKKFQKDYGLVPDGKWGPMSDHEMTKALRAHDTKKLNMQLKVGATATAASTAADTVMTQVTTLSQLGLTSDIIDYTITGLAVFGVGLVGYSMYKKFTRPDDYGGER